jgi:hypothetical protein
MKMLRMVLLVLVGVIAVNADVMAGGSKNSGTLVVNNTSAQALLVMINPPASLLGLTGGANTGTITAAQFATLNPAAASQLPAGQSFSTKLKRGTHIVASVEATATAGVHKFRVQNVTVYKKGVSTVNAAP